MRTLILSFVLVACSSSLPPPESTGTVCPDPDPGALTWENFGQQFMTTYCNDCHASTLKHADRNGAPLYHDYDTLMGVLYIPDHIDSYAGSGPSATNTRMPPSECPNTPGGALGRSCPVPTEAERTNLSLWIACERNRPH